MSMDAANAAGNGASSARSSEGLSERDLAVLAFERQDGKVALGQPLTGTGARRAVASGVRRIHGHRSPST